MRNRPFQIVSLLIIILLTDIFIDLVPLVYAQSGEMWTEPVNLSNAGSSTNPSIVIDKQGTIHVIWVDEFDGYKYVKSTDGVEWTSPITVRFPFSPEDDTQPLLLADEDGGIYALWQNKFNDLYYSRAYSSSDLSSGWSSPSKLADSVMDYNAEVSSQDILHVGFISSLSTENHPAGVYYVRLSRSSRSNAIILYSSQYFRPLQPEEANVHLTISETSEVETVYMVWDDRPQNRILMSKSTDAGVNWAGTSEVIVPEASSGFSAPFNANIDVLNEGLLLMWQVGDPGVRCAQYSKWSTDGGESWNEPINMFNEFAVCPERSEFLSIDPRFSVALLSTQGILSLIAWNGTQWSEPEIQSDLSAISNPRTFNTITFGCQQFSSYSSSLYVVGCDQGSDGDIWLLSRKLDSLENLFPSPSAWSLIKNVTISPSKILSLTSVADQESSIHVLWVETPTLQSDQVEPKIQYAREVAGEWSTPSSVITGLNGLPDHLSVTIDDQQRLLLVWVDQNTGDILFSWANASRADIPPEWINPIILPSPSILNDSPDILVDATGHIVVVYAVTVNENRGIYITQSNDLGGSWSSPVKVFDAAFAGWDGIDQPKITLTGDGTLHLLFHQVSLRGSPQTSGLYYSQSIDGGITWSPPEKAVEQVIRWSDIIGYDSQVIHRIWQQKENSIALTFHQLSQDGGQTWEAPIKISTNDATTPEPAVSIDWNGNLHLIQLGGKDNQLFQEWEWSGEEKHWRSVETKNLNEEGQSTPVSIQAGVTPKGTIYALLLFEHTDLKEEFESKLLNTSRSLNLTGNLQNPFNASIAIPVATLIPTENSNAQLNPTPLSPLTNLPTTPSSEMKNIIGVILIISAVSIILIFVFPRKKKPLE